MHAKASGRDARPVPEKETPIWQTRADREAVRCGINEELARFGLPQLHGSIGPICDAHDGQPVGWTFLGVESVEHRRDELTISVRFRARGPYGVRSITYIFNRNSAEHATVRIIPHVRVGDVSFVALVREDRPLSRIDPKHATSAWLLDWARGFPTYNQVEDIRENVFRKAQFEGAPEPVPVMTEAGIVLQVPGIPPDFRLDVLRIALRKLGGLLMADPKGRGSQTRFPPEQLRFVFLDDGLTNTGHEGVILYTFVLELPELDPDQAAALVAMRTGPEHARIQFHPLSALLTRAYRQRHNVEGDLALSPLILLAERYGLLK